MKRFFAKLVLITLCCGSVYGIRMLMREKIQVPNSPISFPTWSSFGEYQRLEMLLKGFGIESIIDVPSLDIPDFQKHDLGIKHYLGVADSFLQAQGLQAQFGSLEKTFMHFRLDADVLPKSDLILCWDKLSTFSEQKVRAVLAQFKKSGAKFLMMRHYPFVSVNLEVTEESFRPINWNNPPFHFPEPIIHIMEEGEDGITSLALWSLDKL